MLQWFSSPKGPTLAELVMQSLCSIEGGYDRLAEKFDHSVFRTPDLVLEPLAQHFYPCERALDIGCGTGAVVQRLQPFCQELTGIDLSRAMLSKARENLAPAEVQWIHGDFLKTYWENSFDLITTVGVLGHIDPKDHKLFAQRIASALKPGGCLITVVGDLRGHRWLSLPALLFDSVMRLRNLLWRPRFVMYYLSFVLPHCAHILEEAGLEVDVLEAGLPRPYSQLKVVRARRPCLQAREHEAPADDRRSGLSLPD